MPTRQGLQLRLRNALSADDRKGLNKLLRKAPKHLLDINHAIAGNGSETAVFVTAQAGQLEMLKLLLLHNANPNQGRTTDGVTPVWTAAANGHAECLKLLLLHNATPDLARTTDGATPVLMAAHNGHAECLKLLLLHNANPDLARTTDGMTPVFVAAQEGQAECLKQVLQEWAHHGEDSVPGTRCMPAHPELVYRRTGEWKGWAHFLGHDTAENRAQDALEDKAFAALKLKLLLLHNANPDLALPTDGATPVFIAAQKGHAKCLKLLLLHNANPDLALPTDGATPVFIAAQKGHAKCLKLLLLHNANPNQALIGSESTPSHAAVLNGHTEVLELLLEHKSNPAQAIADDYQCLTGIANDCGHAGMAALLLRTRKCDACQKPGTRSVCKGCSKGRYCSHACQKSHWAEHKASCEVQQLKYHSKYCESTALFGPEGLCSGCGEGQHCNHPGCAEAGCRRHRKSCKVGKKKTA